MTESKSKSWLAAIALYLFGGLLFLACLGLAYHLWTSKKVSLAQEEHSRAQAVDAGPRVTVVERRGIASRPGAFPSR